MAVYVDQPLWTLRAGGRRMRMSHLWADDLAELHAFAARLGLRRAWFQSPPAASWPHYDIAKSTRAQAIAAGAIEADRLAAARFRAAQEGRADTVARIDATRARKAGAAPILPLALS